MKFNGFIAVWFMFLLLSGATSVVTTYMAYKLVVALTQYLSTH